MAEKTEEAKQAFQDWMDSQSGYIGKTKKAEWWKNHEKGKENQENFSNVMDPNAPGKISITGTTNEQAGAIEGLQRAKTLTGQNPYEIGEDFQEAYGNIKKRASGQDTGSELMRANKAGAVANARQQMEQQGVKGGAALGAVSAVERSKAYDVNNQMMDHQRQAQNDYLNAVKANANFTTANEMNFRALASDKDFKAPAQPSNGFGTVICTELYRQGYYSEEIYKADQVYGLKVMQERPLVYIGYRAWADELVPLMQESKGFTKAVAFFAVPWAKNMAGKKSLFGKLISKIGEPLCAAIGFFVVKGFIDEIEKA